MFKKKKITSPEEKYLGNQCRQKRTVSAWSRFSFWAEESRKWVAEPGERRSVLQKITVKSTPNSLIQSRWRHWSSPACLINLTCREQRPWWVVIPSIVITSITVLHLTAGRSVTVGHVLGLPHEKLLHDGVESGTQSKARGDALGKKHTNKGGPKKVGDLHSQKSRGAWVIKDELAWKLLR